MASAAASATAAASSDEIMRSDDKVCDDLFNAAHNGNLDEVARVVHLAKEKGVVNKV